MKPDSLLNRLHDIQELDPVGIWPLATGWWLVLALIVLVILLFMSVRRWRPDWRRFLPRYSWTRDAVHELTRLQNKVGRADVKMLAAELSELLRRIAIARCGRDSCAGLHGEPWLAWLSDHDPGGFDWLSSGRVLLDLPYAPPGNLGDQPEMHRLIDAAMVWTAHPGECPMRQGKGHGV